MLYQHDNIDGAKPVLIEPEALANDALDRTAVDSAFQVFFGNRQTQSGSGLLVAARQNNKILAGNADIVSKYAPVISRIG